jgi:hypothetical protein
MIRFNLAIANLKLALAPLGLIAMGLFGCNPPPIPTTALQTTTAQPTPKATPQKTAAAAPSPLPTVTVTATPTVTITPTAAIPPRSPEVVTEPKTKSAPPNFCTDQASWVALIETDSFWVSICTENSDNGVYVGVDRRDPSRKIRLSLSQGRRTYFEARNGNVVYILADTPKGKFLTVTEGGKELLREPTLQWIENIR